MLRELKEVIMASKYGFSDPEFQARKVEQQRIEDQKKVDALAHQRQQGANQQRSKEIRQKTREVCDDFMKNTGIHVDGHVLRSCDPVYPAPDRLVDAEYYNYGGEPVEIALRIDPDGLSNPNTERLIQVLKRETGMNVEIIPYVPKWKRQGPSSTSSSNEPEPPPDTLWNQNHP